VKIVTVKELAIPEIKVIRFARFCDHRGYFTEHFRRSDFHNNPLTTFLKGAEFTQTNESYSKAGTVRGLHFQWNPYMGKLVRTVEGHLIDLVLDIRKGAPTFGKIIAYDMPSGRTDEFNEWIWVPPGFAHGTLLVENTAIEYFCTGEYSPTCEAGISPLAQDIDWSLCERNLRDSFNRIAPQTPFITDKDKSAFTVSAWARDDRSNNFIYKNIG
jgi:dTDP-4-dehydrorhamnose 3,5-epimerase